LPRRFYLFLEICRISSRPPLPRTSFAIQKFFCDGPERPEQFLFSLFQFHTLLFLLFAPSDFILVDDNRPIFFSYEIFDAGLAQDCCLVKSLNRIKWPKHAIGRILACE
jgi:hypothetical protein